MALAVVRSGNGDCDQVVCLLRVVYLSVFMRGGAISGSYLSLYQRAEAVLDACIARAERGETWTLAEDELVNVERVLVVHDEQLAAIPKHRYLTAWDRLQRFVNGCLSQLDQLPSKDLQGQAREYVANNYFVRNGFTPLDGKCGVNCFDGVYIKGDTVYINEVKPLNANGSVQLNGPSGSLPTQMTDGWIDSAVTRLRNGDANQRATADLIQKAIDSGKLVKIIAGVNSNGATLVKIK